MTQRHPEPLTQIHGWTIHAHPAFLDALEALATEVEKRRANDPAGYKQKNATKRLAALTTLAFDVIPRDPTRAEYRQGGTLGEGHKHWFRAKFFQQYRLFFRYHRDARIIVYAWVNDENTKRAYESKVDAYATFRRMLERGNPPSDWTALLKQAQAHTKRLTTALRAPAKRK